MIKKIMVTMYCSVCGKSPYEMGRSIKIHSNGSVTIYYVCSKECSITLLEYHRLAENARIDERIENIINKTNKPNEINRVIEYHKRQLNKMVDGDYLTIRVSMLKDLIDDLSQMREKEKSNEKPEPKKELEDKGIPCKKCGTYENVSPYKVKYHDGSFPKCTPYFCPTCLTIAHSNNPTYIYTKLDEKNIISDKDLSSGDL
jgi:hypothetical protein